jgi:hypothetical protein
VIDEACAVADAARAGAFPFAVAGEHEQVGPLGRRDDLALRAPAERDLLGAATEECGGVGQERVGSGLRDGAHRERALGPPAAPEQSGARALRQWYARGLTRYVPCLTPGMPTLAPTMPAGLKASRHAGYERALRLRRRDVGSPVVRAWASNGMDRGVTSGVRPGTVGVRPGTCRVRPRV